jgi:hypothetical protein
MHDEGSLMTVEMSANMCLQHSAFLPPANGKIEMNCAYDGPAGKNQISIPAHSETVFSVKDGV